MMSRDRRGLAVLMDAMLFLVVLTVLSASIIMPGTSVNDEGRSEMAKSFHTVMLGGEVPGGDGSAMSRTSLSAYIILTSQDGPEPTAEELERIGMAVNRTIQEIESMGQTAWWTLVIDEEKYVFGQRCEGDGTSLYVDRRVLNDDSSVLCFLTIAA